MTPNLKSYYINKSKIIRGPRKGQFIKKILLDKMENAQKPLT